MTILALSDTHGSFQFSPFLEIVQADKPDMVIHCGDGVRDAADIAALNVCPVVSVAGNCDSEGKRECVVRAQGHTIFVTHGHAYGVGGSLTRLQEAAHAHNADIVLYGHTHTPSVSFSDGLWIINPGSLCRPRGEYVATFCRIFLTKDSVAPTMVQYQ